MVTPNRTAITNKDVMEQIQSEKYSFSDLPVITGYEDIKIVDGRENERGDFDTCTQEIFDILTKPFYNLEWMKWINSIWQKEKYPESTNMSTFDLNNECFFVIEGNRFYSAQNIDDSLDVAIVIKITPDITNHIWSGFIIHELSHINACPMGERLDNMDVVWEYVEDKWSQTKNIEDVPFEVWREIVHNRDFHNNFTQYAKEVKNLNLINDEEYNAIMEYYSLIGPGKNTKILPQHLVMKNKFSG